MIEIDIQKKLEAPTGTMNLDVEFKMKKGSFLTIYGKSGAGKTSILRMIAGLMNPDKGSIKVNNQIWFNSKQKINLKAQKRKSGFVFQDYALFPNMTVKQNLEFALAAGKTNDIISNLIEIMELGNLQHRKPSSLSGGQQQRVALARAIVQQPALLMLDEPLSALDQEMRQKLQDYILTIHREFQLTTLLISHDPREILKLSDQVIKLEQGKIDSIQTPIEFLQDTSSGQTLEIKGTLMELKSIGQKQLANISITPQLLDCELSNEHASTLKSGDDISIQFLTDYSNIKKSS